MAPPPTTTEQLLGCTLPQYVAYLNSLLAPDMTWANWGSLWHIDHRVPIKYGAEPPDAPTQVRRLHFSNTRPAYAADNLAKGNRVAEPVTVEEAVQTTVD